MHCCSFLLLLLLLLCFLDICSAVWFDSFDWTCHGFMVMVQVLGSSFANNSFICPPKMTVNPSFFFFFFTPGHLVSGSDRLSIKVYFIASLFYLT